MERLFDDVNVCFSMLNELNPYTISNYCLLYFEMIKIELKQYHNIIFSHLKWWVAQAGHNFKLLNMSDSFQVKTTLWIWTDDYFIFYYYFTDIRWICA